MIRRLAILLLFLLSTHKLFAVVVDVNARVKAEAMAQVASFVNLIPQGKESEYGFLSRSDFSRIKIEEPYQVYYVTKEDQELALIPTNWRVPLSVNGKYKALLTVELRDGKPKVVDFGSRLLAEKLQEFEQLQAGKLKERVMIRNTILVHDYLSGSLDELCSMQGDGFTKHWLNAYSAVLLYQVNFGAPTLVSTAKFFQETMDCAKESF